MLDRLSSFLIVEDPNLVIRSQRKFPRSKKKRIQKKWKKNQNNWVSHPDPDYYVNKWSGIITCHPVAAKRLLAHTVPAPRSFERSYLGVF